MARLIVAAGGLVALAILLTGPAQAEPLRLVYDGYLSANPSVPDTLDGKPLPFLTPFNVRADFDSSQPNFFLCSGAPCPGMAWYAPSTFTMIIQGLTYDVSRVQDDPLFGQAVVVFDQNSPFSNVGDPVSTRHYGIGFFSALNPAHIGIIGDWSYADPDVTIGTLGPTVFETFYSYCVRKFPALA